jgi:hypothetical protein
LWLVVLATLPFTAPFATLDLTDLVGATRPHAVTAIVSGSAVSSPSQTDAGDATASDACLQRTHPFGRSELVLLVSPLDRDVNPPPGALVGPAAFVFPSEDDAVRVVALRL